MKSTKILLAEDDSNLGILLKNYLSAKELESSLFINGKLALKAFREENYQPLYSRHYDA